MARTPESLDGAVEPDAVRLYALIRDRMLASQMAAAHSEKLEIVLATPGGEVALEAAGARLVFDGFLRVCGAEDREIAGDGIPPALDPGERVRIEEVRVVRRVTVAPPRYTEAGLVGRLEALGIGRPSTWAVIVGVLRERGYAAIEGGCFAPLERGRVATAFLEEFFGRWVEYGFTSAMEEELDRIAGGEAAWKSVLGGFWGAFSGGVALGADIAGPRQVRQHLRKAHRQLPFQPAWLLRLLLSLAGPPPLAPPLRLRCLRLRRRLLPRFNRRRIPRDVLHQMAIHRPRNQRLMQTAGQTALGKLGNATRR